MKKNSIFFVDPTFKSRRILIITDVCNKSKEETWYDLGISKKLPSRWSRSPDAHRAAPESSRGSSGFECTEKAEPKMQKVKY